MQNERIASMVEQASGSAYMLDREFIPVGQVSVFVVAKFKLLRRDRWVGHTKPHHVAKPWHHNAFNQFKVCPIHAEFGKLLAGWQTEAGQGLVCQVLQGDTVHAVFFGIIQRVYGIGASFEVVGNRSFYELP
jgi:hypothetical protein